MTSATPIDPDALRAEALEESGIDYRIGPSDLLAVTVFQVPDLSSDSVRVDARGTIQIPLIGSLQAAGRSPQELAELIQAQLGTTYLRNPRVSVTVREASNQKVTIDGAVAKPGVYEMKGRTTLLQAVAMAEGVTRVANLRNVAIFRDQNNQRTVALFDLQAIRQGQAADPVLLGDDIVVVDTSRLSVIMREVVAAVPALAIFRPY